MQDAFFKWGDCISFDVTYNLLRERTSETKQWGLGLFTGFDTNLRIVLFGCCLLSSEKKEDFMLLFNNFFQLMGKQPQTIITD